MTDVVDKATRSRMMSGIRSKNTNPELLIRKGLFAKGYRYKLHDKSLPGKPDLVLPKYSAIIQVQGCFWHGHNCHLFRLPKTRTNFWQNKITQNKVRDSKNLRILKTEGWYVATVWECAIKGKNKLQSDFVIDKLVNWLLYGKNHLIVKGKTK